MPRFAANLSFLYTELPFLERFAAAAEDGFRGVEYMFPYEYPAEQLVEQLQRHKLEQVLINSPAGDWNAGERGLACIAGREAEFAASIDKAIEYAHALKCPRIHVMAGLRPRVTESTETGAAALDEAIASWDDTYLKNIRVAAKKAETAGVQLLLEPICQHCMPRYYMDDPKLARNVIRKVRSEHLKLQLDLFHIQQIWGDLTHMIKYQMEFNRLGHVQIAGVPDRHEPDIGEVNYDWLFRVLDETGYDGWVGCEYNPVRGAVPNGTHDGLGWMRKWL
jgi:putative hydroxypyruvate isomerase